MEIRQEIVNRNIENSRSYGRNNKKKFITVHQTGNTNRGANAEMHARLQSNGNSRLASWHWQVDDSVAIQSFLHVVSAWHCGDGRGDGNMNSIGVEIAINSDGNYIKAVENGAKLVAKIMKDENISIGNVKQHWDWSRKNCPAQIRAGRDGINWNKFIEMVQAELDGKPTPKPDKEAKPVPTPKPSQATYTGNSIVEYLNSIGQNSSFSARAKIASAKGIRNYTGTASQNMQLLNMLRSEGNPQATKPSAKPSPRPKMTAREVAEEIYRGQGDWGDNPQRRQRVIERGYSYSEVQGIVEELVKGKKASPKKSVDTIAREILYGRNYGGWGTGNVRRQRLREAGYDPSAVQRRVNQLA